jgi:hypothetical protein
MRCLRQKCWPGRRWRGWGPINQSLFYSYEVFETDELAREEVERVGSNQSIPVLELQSV